MFTAHWNDFRFLPWVKEISNNCFSLPSSQHLLHPYSQESVFRYWVWCTTAGAAADEDYGSSPSSKGRGDGGCTFPHCSTTLRLQPEAKARCFSLYAGQERSAPLRHTAVGQGATRVQTARVQRRLTEKTSQDVKKGHHLQLLFWPTAFLIIIPKPKH